MNTYLPNNPEVSIEAENQVNINEEEKDIIKNHISAGDIYDDQQWYNDLVLQQRETMEKVRSLDVSYKTPVYTCNIWKWFYKEGQSWVLNENWTQMVNDINNILSHWNPWYNLNVVSYSTKDPIKTKRDADNFLNSYTSVYNNLPPLLQQKYRNPSAITISKSNYEQEWQNVLRLWRNATAMKVLYDKWVVNSGNINDIWVQMLEWENPWVQLSLSKAYPWISPTPRWKNFSYTNKEVKSSALTINQKLENTIDEFQKKLLAANHEWSTLSKWEIEDRYKKWVNLPSKEEFINKSIAYLNTLTVEWIKYSFSEQEVADLLLRWRTLDRSIWFNSDLQTDAKNTKIMASSWSSFVEANKPNAISFWQAKILFWDPSTWKEKKTDILSQDQKEIKQVLINTLGALQAAEYQARLNADNLYNSIRHDPTNDKTNLYYVRDDWVICTREVLKNVSYRPNDRRDDKIYDARYLWEERVNTQHI